MLATCQVFHVRRRHLQASQKGREYEYKGKEEKRGVMANEQYYEQSQVWHTNDLCDTEGPGGGSYKEELANP